MRMKTALITGVGRGIGKALAQKFLKEGWNVIGTSQSGKIDYEYKNLKVFGLEMTSNDSVEALIGELGKNGTKLDMLINNAGILVDNDDTKVTVDNLKKTMSVNLFGTIELTERMISKMNASSHIINISSSAGSLTGATDLRTTHYPYHYPAYKISKAALNMYTRTLATRLNNEGSSIIVSSVHPGWVKTDMGGDDAPITPEEAATDIYKLAISNPETGQFWYKGNKYPW